MIVLVASPDQITDEDILYITLSIDDKKNQETYKGLYLNLILKKVGTLVTIPTYQQRYNGESLTWEINKYTYNSYGTFNVTANIYNTDDVITTCSFIVEERCRINKTNVCNNVTNLNKQNPNARSINYPTFVQPTLNTNKVQVQGIDYSKSNIIEPVSKFTVQENNINTLKVQKAVNNVNSI
jgi:hypothetical protein